MKAKSIRYLRSVAKDFLRRNFAMELDIPIIINEEFTHAQGRFLYRGEHEPIRIELSGKTVQYGTDEAIIGVLKHELVHYALYSKGLPSDDGDDYFEETLRRLDVPPTRSTIIGLYQKLVCPECGEDYVSSKPQELLKYVVCTSPCCGKEMTREGETVYDGSVRYDKKEGRGATA